jgi:hypothetical protein
MKMSGGLLQLHEYPTERHPVAITLRRKRGVDDARVSKREALTAL